MSEKLNILDEFISRETAYAIHNYLKDKTQPHYPDDNHPNGLSRFSIYHNHELNFFDTIDGTGKKIFSDGVKPEDLFMLDLNNLIANSIKTYFNLPNNKINLLTMTYTNYGPTQYLPLHTDWGVSKYDVHSAILYLTDDYDGGEFLWYTHYDWQNPETNEYISHKPKSGQLYYFEGTQFGQHEVLPVTSGERSCIVFFYTGVDLKVKAEQTGGYVG